MFSEPLREGLGIETEPQKGGEIGSGSGPSRALVEDGAQGFQERDRRWRDFEGAAHVVFGAAERRSGGDGAGESGGVAGGVGRDGYGRAEYSADGVAEGAEDASEALIDYGEDRLLGAAGGGREAGQSDSEGAGDKVGRRSEIGGDGEEDGALDPELDGFAVAGLAAGNARPAGKTAESVGDLGRKGRDVIESEDPVVAGELEQLAR